MRNKIYIASICFMSMITILICIRLLGFIFWINNAHLDKWIVLGGFVIVPVWMYLFLKGIGVSIRS
ncbi:hypothetical protein JOC93_003464 [Priestia taiwanensis]|nr:hypothetical protein [Priestia taiwanensis]